MAKIVIIDWSQHPGWVDESHWPLKAYCDRIGLCTNLKGTELKRVSRELRAKAISELEISHPEKAGALITTLQSIGAEVSIVP